MENPTYLGDAVYAYFDGFGIELRLNDHRAQCSVYIEPQVFNNLTNFVKVNIRTKGRTTMKSLQTLAICDLNAAVAARANYHHSGYTTKCLMAQFAKRITGKVVTGSTPDAATFTPWSAPSYDYPFRVVGMEEFVHLFDGAQNDETKIAEIRRQLPMEVEVEML